MPVTVRKVGKNSYRVSTPNMVHAKKTSKKKAMAQRRLLNAVEHSNWRPSGRGGGSPRGKSNYMRG